MQEIKCEFRNGFYKHHLDNIFYNLKLNRLYHLTESENPQVVFFGPYGNDIPKIGNYIRVGVFPECIMPALNDCEFALGTMPNHFIDSSNYLKFDFFGKNPDVLINQTNNIIPVKEFCSFFYSHHIKYREEFFKQLSLYKKIDSPGKSMNNMSSPDVEGISRYQSKLNFLAQHKFDISFENFSQQGYCTEKLYESLTAGCVPIYFGDPKIGDHSYFNPKAFINALEFIKPKNKMAIDFLEKYAVEDIDDYRPAIKNNLHHKIKRKIKYVGRNYKMELLTNCFNFKPLIDYIKEVDNDDSLYASYASEKWAIERKVEAEVAKQQKFWKKIISQINT